MKIQTVSVSGSAFSIAGLPLPFSLAAGKSAILTVAFNPNAQATFDGSVSIGSNATNSPQEVTLTGSGTLPLQITTATVPDAQVGKAYQSTLSASGGTAPYQWSTAAGSSLPAGLGLDSSSGTISGTPTNAGLANFAIQLVDASNPQQVANGSYNMNVLASPWDFSDTFDRTSPVLGAWTQLQNSSDVTIVKDPTGLFNNSNVLSIHYLMSNAGSSVDRWLRYQPQQPLKTAWFRWYVDLVTPSSGITVGQRKLLYIKSGEQDCPGYVACYSLILDTDGYSNSHLYQTSIGIATGNGTPSIRYYINSGTGASMKFDQKYCIEMAAQISSPGGYDGNVYVWIDGVQQVMNREGGGGPPESVKMRDGSYSGANPVDGYGSFSLGEQYSAFAGSVTDEYRFISNFVMSTSGRIGCN